MYDVKLIWTCRCVNHFVSCVYILNKMWVWCWMYVACSELGCNVLGYAWCSWLPFGRSMLLPGGWPTTLPADELHAANTACGHHVLLPYLVSHPLGRLLHRLLILVLSRLPEPRQNPQCVLLVLDRAGHDSMTLDTVRMSPHALSVHILRRSPERSSTATHMVKLRSNNLK